MNGQVALLSVSWTENSSYNSLVSNNGIKIACAGGSVKEAGEQPDYIAMDVPL